MKLYLGLILSVLLFLSAGCAGTYRQIEIEKIEFRNSQVNNNIEFSYKYDILSYSNNKRYASYEKDENINIVALKIQNNSDHDILINENTLKVYAGTNQLQILKPDEVLDEMHQNSYPYFFYSLLFLNISNGESMTTIPIGLPIGLLNFFIARTANGYFKEDLIKYSLMDKEIKQGEPLAGIISLYNSKYDELRFEFVEQLAAKKNYREDKVQINPDNDGVQKSIPDSLEAIK